MQSQNLLKQTLNTCEALDVIRILAAQAPHRTALAERVCEHFGFRDALGRTQRSTCLSALRSLERAERLTLPVSRNARRRPAPRGLDAPVPGALNVPSHVVHVGTIELVAVNDDVHRRVWTELMRREHPLGAPTLAGHQLRYLVRSAHGWLGALGFAAAALKLTARERWVGWDDAQRRAHLHRSVGLSRFLIRPGIECANLASHILGKVLRALPGDFERRYGYRPWFVESFNDPATHTGICYRASNWQRLGLTTGRGRQDRARSAAVRPKEVYVYVFEADFRDHIAPSPTQHPAPLDAHEGLDGADWAAHEFADAPLGDRRLSRRLVTSATLAAHAPTQMFCNVAADNWAAVKGYYRLIDQGEDSAVTPHNILAPHRARTLRRMQAQSTVLCVQDGTDFNYATHAHCDGLGVIGRNQTGAQTRGLHLHSTLAISTQGLPLGVLKAQFDAPQPRDGHDAQRGAPKPTKSQRWLSGYRDCAELKAQCPHTRLVSVMDREADMFELFDAQRNDPRAELLVRAKSDRRLLLGDDARHHKTPTKLFEHLRAAPERGRLQIAVGRQSARPKTSKQALKAKRKERIAQVSVHFERITLRPTKPGLEPLSLWCVHVREAQPPDKTKPLEWYLLSTVSVETMLDAQTMLTWYGLRWRIEDWHRVIKSGCRVERLAHDSAERLERAIAIRLVIAWRVHLLTLLGREVPELPAQLLFSNLEIEVLSAWAASLRRPRPAPKTLGDAVKLTAIIGGYLARNNDGPPGTELLWQGLTKLVGMCAGYELHRTMAAPGPEP
jgi:hypothetical protein